MADLMRMKRQIEFEPTPRRSIPISSKFNNVFSSLKEFNRSELLSIILESKRILSLECSTLFLTVPDEIWKIIFGFSIRHDREIKNIELQFRLLSCVSARWSLIINDIVKFYFSLHVDLSYSAWTLSKFTHLSSLSIEHYPMRASSTTTTELENVMKRMTNLTFLKVSFYEDKSFMTDRVLKKLTNLITLDVVDCRRISSEGLKPLINLQTLHFQNCLNNCDEGIKKLTGLTHLRCYDNTFSDNGVKNLTNLSILRPGNLISDHSLTRLKKLSQLFIEDNKLISDKGLKRMKNLSLLELHNNHISNNGIRNLTNLNSLLACSDKITDRGLKKLGNLTHISYIRLFHSVYSLENLRKLHVSNESAINDNIMEKLTNLSSLSIHKNRSITNNGLKNLTQLRKLNISGHRSISNEGIKNLSNLENLNISRGSIINNEGISHLVNLKKLDISCGYHNYKSGNESCVVDDEGVVHLTQLRRLICAQNYNITNHALENLVNLTHIEICHVHEKLLNFDGITHLTKLTSLKCRRNFLSLWEKKHFRQLSKMVVPHITVDEELNMRD
jgi:hypothetical protein